MQSSVFGIWAWVNVLKNHVPDLGAVTLPIAGIAALRAYRTGHAGRAVGDSFTLSFVSISSGCVAVNYALGVILFPVLTGRLYCAVAVALWAGFALYPRPGAEAPMAGPEAGKESYVPM